MSDSNPYFSTTNPAVKCHTKHSLQYQGTTADMVSPQGRLRLLLPRCRTWCNIGIGCLGLLQAISLQYCHKILLPHINISGRTWQLSVPNAASAAAWLIKIPHSRHHNIFSVHSQISSNHMITHMTLSQIRTSKRFEAYYCVNTLAPVFLFRGKSISGHKHPVSCDRLQPPPIFHCTELWAAAA